MQAITSACVDATAFTLMFDVSTIRAAWAPLPLELAACPGAPPGQHPLYFEFWRIRAGTHFSAGLPQREVFESAGAAAGSALGRVVGAVTGGWVRSSTMERGSRELSYLGLEIGRDWGRRLAGAVEQAFARYDELFVGIPYACHPNSEQPHLFVMGMYCNNAAAILGNHALRFGYRKRFARFQPRPGAGCSILSPDGAELRLDLTPSKNTETTLDLAAHDAITEQPLLGVLAPKHDLRAAQLMSSRLMRDTQSSRASVTPVAGHVAIQREFIPGISDTEQALTPLSSGHVFGAFQQRNLQLTLTPARHAWSS